MSESNNKEEQTFQFDKFMKDFETKDAGKREKVRERSELIEENPNLEYFRRHQEDWRNSTRWRK
tara:strand:- start:481 stop:672 length:192 start_codon:yes stop_codon:yes gene_type:complete